MTAEDAGREAMQRLIADGLDLSQALDKVARVIAPYVELTDEAA